jgi:two-component system, OmpR family, response regulator
MSMSAHHYLLIGGNNTLVNAMVSAAMGTDDKLLTACDPSEAVRLIDRSQPDAVLWAIDPSDEEAVVACRTLRRHSHAPIVMLVASAAKEYIVRAYRLGADAQIPIPFDRREFSARVHAVLRRQL